jgi:ribosome modulation factor
MYDTFVKYPEVGNQIDDIIARLQSLRDNPSHLCDVGCGMGFIADTLRDNGCAAITKFYEDQQVSYKAKLVQEGRTAFENAGVSDSADFLCPYTSVEASKSSTDKEKREFWMQGWTEAATYYVKQ